MTDENLCRRCARCCYAKVIIDDEIVYTHFPCPYLDESTKLCTVYDKRYEVNPECLRVEDGIRLGIFPADCPYVKDLGDYVPPREELTEEEVQLFTGQIQDALGTIPNANKS